MSMGTVPANGRYKSGTAYLAQALKFSLVHTHACHSVPFFVRQSSVSVENFSHALSACI